MPDPIIKVVIPARNERTAIAKVIADIPEIVTAVIVVDNGSTDGTATVAQAAGAQTILVNTPGYGRACLAGIQAAGECDILIFLDGDASDFPEQLTDLIAPILTDDMDFVIGSRIIGECERGALTPQQVFGNHLACLLMHMIWKGRYTDLGPFRAIRRDALVGLNMQAPTFGWTVEMQIRVLKRGLKYTEIPVNYRKRIGKSKISGTVTGVCLAGYYILSTIFREAISPRSSQTRGQS